jgi:queuine tRNA-ribosyltransferase
VDNIFRILKSDKTSQARTGILTLPHGEVKTPAFMPVGTNGTVKGMHHTSVAEIGYNLILGNTYHLYLRPGIEVLESYGGLHNFSAWDGNILTDSGGFQIFSLAKLRKIREEGVEFQSHIDGSRHHLTPERVVEIQKIIGSDILMCLDVCTPPEISHRQAREAMEITHRWAERSIRRWQELEDFEGQLFGIVQGNFYEDLRQQSSEFISSLNFPGLAIGGLSVGESPEIFSHFLGHTTQFLPNDKVRYVMGIGSPDYIMDAIANGIDLFDCVLATRIARNGAVFSDDGLLNLKKAIHEKERGPIVDGCSCHACTTYSRGYLRHLFKCGEMLGGMLATEHNLTYLYNLMERSRQAIEEGNFTQFKEAYLDRYYGK